MTTSKLQLNCRTIWRLAEQKSYKDIKKATSKLVGGAEMQNGLTSRPQVVVDNLEGYLRCRGHPWGAGASPPCQTPQPSTPVLATEVCITPGRKNRQGFHHLGGIESCWKPRLLVKELIHTPPGLWQRNSSVGLPETYREKWNLWL